MASHWGKEEDRLLEQLVLKLGDRKLGEYIWQGVADSFNKQNPNLGNRPKTRKQCRDRWMNHLRPDVTKSGPWSTEEEEKMVAEHRQKGNKWTSIAIALRRTEISVKNRWYSAKRKLEKMGGQKKCEEIQGITESYIFRKYFSSGKNKVVSQAVNDPSNTLLGDNDPSRQVAFNSAENMVSNNSLEQVNDPSWHNGTSVSEQLGMDIQGAICSPGTMDFFYDMGIEDGWCGHQIYTFDYTDLRVPPMPLDSMDTQGVIPSPGTRDHVNFLSSDMGIELPDSTFSTDGWINDF